MTNAKKLIVAACVSIAALLSTSIACAAADSTAGSGQNIRRIEIRVDPGAFQGPGTWPLGAGVPLPKGRFRSVDGLRLRSEKHGFIPVQINPRNNWLDGSIKWIWLDFQGDPNDRYALDLDAGQEPMPAPKPALRLVDGQKQIEVDTGAIRVVWDRLSASPVKVEIGEVQTTGDGRGIYVTDSKGRKAFLAGERAELAWKVESAGPIRAVVRIEGWYVSQQGERLARAVVRYHLYDGRTFFFMDHTFIFTEDTDRLWFREVAVRFPWQAKRQCRARFGVRGQKDVVAEIASPRDSAWIFQDDYPHFAKKRKHFCVGRTAGGEETMIKEGEAADGWCEASDGRSGIIVAVRDFAPQFPKELMADRQGVTARLWSNRGGKELDYRPATLLRDYYGEDWIGPIRKGPVHGEMVRVDLEGFKRLNPTGLGSAKTHEIFCGYGVGALDPNVSRQWSARFERPPVALADPAWLCASGAFWPMAPKDEKRFPEAERFISSYFDHWLGRMRDFPMTGWISKGLGPELAYERRKDGKVYASFYRLNNVAAYNTPKNVWAAYLRSGDRKYLDFAEPYTRFLADFKTIHWGGGSMRKEKGLLTSGNPHSYLPFYWWSRGQWDTSGQSTDYLAPFRIAYFLRDSRWARDALELYTDAMNRLWSLKTTRTFATPFTHLSMMINAYQVAQDPALSKKIDALADALVDLNDPFGFSIAFYTRSPKHGATYKFDRKIMALLDYYDLFGVEKAKQAVLKATGELFANSCRRAPLSYQNVAPMYLMRCFEWTGNRDYRAAAVAHLEGALEWFREFETGSPNDQQSYQGWFTPDKQGFPFFAVPHVLALMSHPSYEKQTFPYLANMGRDTECPIHLQKKAGQEARLLVNILFGHSEKGGASFRITTEDGKHVESSKVDEVPAHWANLYRITIPSAAPAGEYRIWPGRNRFLVIGCNVDKLVFSLPGGTYFGHRDNFGYAFTRNKPYCFHVPDGQSSFSLKVSRPVRLFDPSGTEEQGARDQTGKLTIDTQGRSGLWSFIAGAAGYLRFEDLMPVVSFGDAKRFFLPEGVVKSKPEVEWAPPAEEGLVEGRFRRGLHIGSTYQARWDTLSEAKDFPFPEGAVECFIRTDWSTHWYPERGIQSFWTLNPLYFGYRNQPQFDNRGMFQTWVQFHPIGQKGRQAWLLRASAYVAFEAGQWNHFACTWRRKPPRYVIFRNGKKIAELAGPAPERGGDGSIMLGPLRATYDELRVSRVVRYEETFSPPTEPFVEDEDTVLLFHFDNDLRSSTRGPIVELERR